MMIPERYSQTETLDKVVLLTGQQPAMEPLRRWAERTPDLQQNVILIGGVGSGKTHLAVSAIRTREKLADKLERGSYEASLYSHTCFINLPHLMDGLRASIAVADSAEEREYRHLLHTCKSVVLDDLGAERVTEYSLERIYVLIDSLYNRQASILATTNVPLSTMAAQGQTRIVSRLSEGATIVKMSTPDIRATRRT